MFWNVEEQELNVKTCQRLILMTSTTDYGLLVTESVTLENQVHLHVYIYVSVFYHMLHVQCTCMYTF